MFMFFAAQIPEDSFSEVTGLLDGILEMFQFIWELGHSFITSVFGIFGLLFPFLPEGVSTAFSVGLVAALIAGVVRFVRGD